MIQDEDVSDELFDEAHKRLTAWGDEYRRISEALSPPIASEPGEVPIKHQRLAAWKETISRALGRAQHGPAEDPRWKRSRRECINCGHRASPKRWGKYVGDRGKKGVVQRQAWVSEACPRCGSTAYRAATLTARGRETRTSPRVLPVPSLSSEALRTEALLKRLPEDYMRDVIHRRYRIGMPDRVACQDLRVPKNIYRLWLRMAVSQFALIILAEKSS